MKIKITFLSAKCRPNLIGQLLDHGNCPVKIEHVPFGELCKLQSDKVYDVTFTPILTEEDHVVSR